MTRRGRVASAGNGEGSDDAELNVPDAVEGTELEQPGQMTLAEINAARQRLADKAPAVERKGAHPARLG